MPRITAKERRARQKQNASRKKRESAERAAVTEAALIQELEEAARIQAHQERLERGRHSTDIDFNTMRDITRLQRSGLEIPLDLKSAIIESGRRRNDPAILGTVITNDGNTWRAHSPSNVSSSSTKKRRRKKRKRRKKKKGGFKTKKTKGMNVYHVAPRSKTLRMDAKVLSGGSKKKRNLRKKRGTRKRKRRRTKNSKKRKQSGAGVFRRLFSSSPQIQEEPKEPVPSLSPEEIKEQITATESDIAKANIQSKKIKDEMDAWYKRFEETKGRQPTNRDKVPIRETQVKYREAMEVVRDLDEKKKKLENMLKPNYQQEEEEGRSEEEKEDIMVRLYKSDGRGET